jgi:hypothetical protein
MTIYTFTAAQVAELTNTFWDIALDDGNGNSLGLYSDDLVQELPAAEVIVGILAQQEEDGTWACAHPDLTDEDVALIRFELDWRAAHMARIAALPQAERAAARSTLRGEIRVAARQEARTAARVAARLEERRAERVEDRQTARRLARQLYRQQVREAAVAAGAITDPDPAPVP